MDSLEANKGRSEETEEEVGEDRYEEGDKIENFLWMAVRTVVVVEDGPEAEAVWTGVTRDGNPEDDPEVVTSVDGNYLSIIVPVSQLQGDLSNQTLIRI